MLGHEMAAGHGRQRREGRHGQTRARCQRLQDLQTAPDLLVLTVDRLHQFLGPVHILDFLFQFLDIGLATVAERALSGTVLGRATRMSDVAGVVGQVGIRGV